MLREKRLELDLQRSSGQDAGEKQTPQKASCRLAFPLPI